MRMPVCLLLTLAALVRADVIADNEAAARVDLCTIADAEWRHYADIQHFSSILNLTTGPVPYLDGDWTKRSGYQFTQQTSASNFALFADPVAPGVSGNMHYLIDGTGAVRYAVGAPAQFDGPVHRDGCLPATASGSIAARVEEYLCSLVMAQKVFAGANAHYANTFAELKAPPIRLYLTALPEEIIPEYSLSLSGDDYGFTVTAAPLSTTPDVPWYYADDSGVLRSNPAAPADASSAILRVCSGTPSWLGRHRARLEADEVSAMKDMRTVFAGERAYWWLKGCFGSFVQMSASVLAYIDGNWVAGRTGYNFTTVSGRNDYQSLADPITIGSTGDRHFFVDSRGLLRIDQFGAGGPTSPLEPTQGFGGNYPADAPAFAVQRLCAVAQAEAWYFADHGEYTDVTGLTTAAVPYLAVEWATASYGYTFDLAATAAAFAATATPASPRLSDRNFHVDATGVVREARGRAAMAGDPAAREGCEAQPPFLNQRVAFAMEAERRARLRLCAIGAAQTAYFADNAAYAPDEATLLQNGPPYLGPAPATQCPAYDITVAGSGAAFAVTTVPNTSIPGPLGRWQYYLDESGLLRGALDGPADISSATIACDAPPPPKMLHAIDPNGDHVVSLSELLRVTQFHNSGGYHCAPGSEDGFAPGPGDQSCAPHDLDFATADWHIGLSEVLRAIQFYNLGGYHACEGAEDGFCAGM